MEDKKLLTVGELKKILKKLPKDFDDMEVYITSSENYYPVTDIFWHGYENELFFSSCDIFQSEAGIGDGHEVIYHKECK